MAVVGRMHRCVPKISPAVTNSVTNAAVTNAAVTNVTNTSARPDAVRQRRWRAVHRERYNERQRELMRKRRQI